MKERPARLTAADIVLVIVLLALPVWALVRQRAGAGRDVVVTVYRDNRLQGVYPLGHDAIVDVMPGVKLEIRGGRVRVAKSNCREGVCMHEGWRSTPGSSIVCVPNRVVVTIGGREPGLDAETY